MKKIIIPFIIFSFSFLMNAQPTITAIKINGRSRQLNNQELTLGALDDDLIIDFQPAIGDTFAFFLENYDAMPVKMAFPIIRYTHLTGGNYTFKYWTEKNNVLSPKGQIKLFVDESLAETWWFYPTVVGCVLLLLGIVFYFWTIYDLHQKIKLETIRNQIAGDLHDEIGSDLGSIVLSIGTAQRKYGKNETELSHKLEEIKEVARSTAANLRDTVWIIQPNNDALPQLLDKIRTFAMRLLSAVNCALIFENEIAGDYKFVISMEQRRCVYLILREAVHNIAKHAQATQATIHANREKEGIRIIVSDNGIGFDPSVPSSDGNGLKNFKSRAMDCFIEITIMSNPSVGTTIAILVPEL
jgi:hypothetical protein